MWIILAVLKWIGILLGAILGLCLLLTVLVIFVPVRYRISFDKQEEFVYSFRFSWLLSFVSIQKKKNVPAVRLYVLGIPVRTLAGGQKKKKENTSGQKPAADGKEETERKPDAESGKDSPETKAASGKRLESAKHKKSGIIKKLFGHRKKKKVKRKKAFSFQKLSSIIGLVKQNRKMIKRLFGEIRALVVYLSPTKIRGKMILGTGDPASTGLVFGGISLFPVLYQDGFRITPDFEEKRFEAKGYLKGRLRVVYFLRLLLRLYKDSELKRLWKQINQIKKEAA